MKKSKLLTFAVSILVLFTVVVLLVLLLVFAVRKADASRSSGEESSTYTLKDNNWNGIISNSMESRYKCTGSCFCFVNRRSSASLFRHGLVFFVTSVSSVVAFHTAKNHFENVCKDRLEAECVTPSVISSSIDDCEETVHSDDLEKKEGAEISSDGATGGRSYECTGRCISREMQSFDLSTGRPKDISDFQIKGFIKKTMKKHKCKQLLLREELSADILSQSLRVFETFDPDYYAKFNKFGMNKKNLKKVGKSNLSVEEARVMLVFSQGLHKYCQWNSFESDHEQEGKKYIREVYKDIKEGKPNVDKVNPHGVGLGFCQGWKNMWKSSFYPHLNPSIKCTVIHKDVSEMGPTIRDRPFEGFTWKDEV